MSIRDVLLCLAEQHGTSVARSKADEWGTAIDEIYQCTGSPEAYVLGAQIQDAANEVLTVNEIDWELSADPWAQTH